MHCPFCGHQDTQVKDSRPSDDGAAIRRRRVCSACVQRFTTIERVQLRELTVLKNDGRRLPFERDKLARSIRIALSKRPIDELQQERLVNGLVRQLEASGEQEIPSRTIGELAMDALREIDEVGYVRFASVYRNFCEAEAFFQILTDMGNTETSPQQATPAPQQATQAKCPTITDKKEQAEDLIKDKSSKNKTTHDDAYLFK